GSRDQRTGVSRARGGRGTRARGHIAVPARPGGPGGGVPDRGSVTVSGHVLGVDDDRGMCRLVAAGLGPRGFEVTWRTSASEALEVVDGVDVDAVVTDLEMAGTNGIELCERILATRPDVPVAVLTAFGNFDAAVAAIRAGAYDFITKPPELDALA